MTVVLHRRTGSRSGLGHSDGVESIVVETAVVEATVAAVKACQRHVGTGTESKSISTSSARIRIVNDCMSRLKLVSLLLLLLLLLLALQL